MQNVDLGGSYGVVAFPDDYTPEQIVAEYDSLEAARKATPPRASDLTVADYAGQIGGSVVRGIGNTIAEIPEGVSIARRTVSDLVPAPVRAFTRLYDPYANIGRIAGVVSDTDTLLNASASGIRSGVKAITPEPIPELEDSILASRLPQGVGSALGFAAGGLVGKAARIPTWLSIGGLGSAVGGAEFYNDAKAHGADEATARISAVIGNAVGTSEALPLGRMMRRLDGISGGTFSKFVIEAGKDTIEEAIQEGVQQLAQNVTARQLYDKDRDLFNDIATNTGVGGATGFLMSALTQALGIPIGRSNVRRQSRDESRARIARVIAEREANASQVGAVSQTPGQEKAAGQEAVGGVRIRNSAENEVGPETGTPITPPPNAPPFPGLTQEAADFLKATDGGVPAFVTSNLERIARENGVDPTGKTPNEIVAALRSAAIPQPAQAAQPPPTPSAGEQVVQGAINELFTPTPQEAPIAFVGRVVRDIVTGWQNAPDIQLVDNGGQLPQEVQAEASAKGVSTNDIDAVRDSKGTVWIVADKVRNADHARRLLLHEAVGHEGVDRAFGTEQEWTAFMQGVAQKHASTPLGAAIRGLYGNDPVTIGKEIVAKLAENPGADPTLWQQIVAAVRNWARRVFKVNISDNDIRVLLQRGRRAVESEQSGVIGRSKYFLKSGGRVLRAKNATVVGPASFAITALHGTPHRIPDRFKLEKIGTGEGGRAYGWGLYFAELLDTAKTYQRMRDENSLFINGVHVPKLRTRASASKDFAIGQVVNNGSVKEAIAQINRIVDEAGYRKFKIENEYTEALEILKSWNDQRVEVRIKTGNVYTVSLLVEPDELLDWDQRLSEQGDNVKTRIKNRTYPAEGYYSIPESLTGQQVYNEIRNMLRGSLVGFGEIESALEQSGREPSDLLEQFIAIKTDQDFKHGNAGVAFSGLLDQSEQRKLLEEIATFAPQLAIRLGGYAYTNYKTDEKRIASEYLRSLGIKGIKFLDRGSRNQGLGNPKIAHIAQSFELAKRWAVENGLVNPEIGKRKDNTWAVWTYPKPTYNYVIFNDADIQITHENGQPVPVREAMGGTSFALNSASTPPIEGMQVAGASAQVGRIAENIYNSREAGGQALEGLAYQRKQFKMARAELKRLADIAYGRVGASTQDGEIIVVPDPNKGVEITDGRIAVDNTFVNTLNAVQVPHSEDQVKAMQAEIFFESAAKRLNNLQAQIETLLTARVYYTELGVAASEIEKIDQSINSLQVQEGILSGAAHGNETVGGRASEIRATEDLRPQRMAQKEALSLRPVSSFFGRQVGRYRDFVERVGKAHKIAAALRDSATDPAEIARLTAESDRWLNLPQSVQESIRAGLPLTNEQRAAAFATLAEVFGEFDTLRERMNEIIAARLPELALEERTLLLKIADFKIKSGMAEVMVADVLAALDGESGGTGTLQSQAVTQELRQRLSAIESFALALGADRETHKALFEWLANPTTELTIPLSASYGVDQTTLSMILAEVKRNPEFGSAIVTLVESSDKKLLNLPIVQLDQISALVSAGNMDSARSLAKRLEQRAKARASVAESGLRESLRSLDAINIERIALEHGAAMFNELASAPEFNAVRSAVSNSPFGLVEPMVAQNNRDTTFKPFGVPGIPSHPGFVMGAADNSVLKSEWFHRADQWHVAAQHHLDAYDAAEALHNADPLANPQPSALGFDLPKVRGLRDAVSRFVPGSFLELSLLSETQRWKTPRLVREMSRTSWFRQHDFVAKMVGGIAGTDLRGRLADFTNHFLIARSIIQKYSDIPERLHAAMKSHPAVQMNMANYREIWNELAHWGRIFGSPVRIGFVLPRSGVVVTAEDLSLLQRQMRFEDELRRRVTETNPTAGIRVEVGGRELVRSAAAVGDFGIPRHLNRQSDSFIADAISAYGSDPILAFDPTTDLSTNSTNAVVRFWNEHIPSLVQHILDVRRGDRAMRLDATMQAVEMATEAQWRSLGTPAIHSLEELVNVLVANSPPMPGWNVRDRIITGLNAELRQYRDAAQRVANERSEREQARNSGVVIAFSADNEFTRPAARLELPSSLYDYGALTPGEHLTVTSRANHERVVAYATAVHRAVAELQSRLDRFRDGTMTEAQASSSYGGDIDEMKQVIGLLRAIGADFEAAYRTGNPTLTQSRWYREGFGLLTSAVLALPTVGLRNMTQGQFETYVMSRAMGLAGHRLTMWRALKAMVKTVGRFATDLGLGALRRTDIGASLLTGKNVQLFSKLADQIAGLILSPNYIAGAQRVHELGYDTRDSFIARLKRIWEETLETVTREEISVAKIKGRSVAALAGVPVKTLRAAFDRIGVQQYDQAINASMLTYATWLHKRMEEVAMTYGAERARQGLTNFDATDMRWQLKPDEFGAFKSDQQNKDALGLFRLFLEASANPEGFQLERNMWAFYQGHQSGQRSQLFTPRQFDAVQRRLLAEFNASTPANRSSAAAGNNVVRNLLTLQGYVSDGLLKLVNLVAGGSRDRTVLAATLGKLPTLAALALMAVLIGYMAGGLTGEWEKRIRGRAPTLATPLDRDFWTSWKRWVEGTLRLGSAQLFYIGDIILAMRGEVQGNRGFDPIGRVFPISVAQRALSSMRGIWNTAKGSGSVSDSLKPMADFGRSMFPYWLEAENAFGASQGVVKQGERIIRGESQVQGLTSDSRQSFGGPSYGPNTIVRRNIGEAVSAYWDAQQAGNEAAGAAALVDAQAQMKKLQDFYIQKYLKAGDSEAEAYKKATQDVWNDYQDINPVVAAMMGKRPTAAQWQLIRGGMSGERAAVVDKAVQAWQAGAMALFGRAGAITREDVGAGRGGGGTIPSRAVALGGGTLRPPGAGLAGSRIGRGLGGTRRRGLTGRRTRSVVGSSRRRLGPRIGGRSVSRRRVGVGTSRRRRFALA